MNFEQVEEYRQGILKFDFLNNELPRTRINEDIIKKTTSDIVDFIKRTSNEIVDIVKQKRSVDRETKIQYVFNEYVLEYVLANRNDLIGYVRVYKF